MAAVKKGTQVIWSVNGLTAVAVAATASNIEQSFSKSNSSDSKEILGDDGECMTKVYYNESSDLSIEVVPSTRAAFPAKGTSVTVVGTDMAGDHSGKWYLTGGSQDSTVDSETRYTFNLKQYKATDIG
jgi:hypothetical protein